MQAELCGVTLHYEQYGQGDRHVLMLHGWGCEIKHFAPIADSLQSDYYITVIDFPAHGQSTPPPQPWGVADFAACVKALILQLGIAPCDIIAHSFGGRVALLMAAENPERVGRLMSRSLSSAWCLPAARASKSRKRPSSKSAPRAIKG